jgi:hypothetical protein
VCCGNAWDTVKDLLAALACGSWINHCSTTGQTFSKGSTRVHQVRGFADRLRWVGRTSPSRHAFDRLSTKRLNSALPPRRGRLYWIVDIHRRKYRTQLRKLRPMITPDIRRSVYPHLKKRKENPANTQRPSRNASHQAPYLFLID